MNVWLLLMEEIGEEEIMGNRLGKSISRILIYAIFGMTLLALLWVVIIRLLGFQLNREFFTFNKEQCIAKEYPTYYHHSGIEGCIFWSRNDYLENRENWKSLFHRDDQYCEQKYGLVNDPNLSFKEQLDLTFQESRDPKCDYEGIKNQKRQENWQYLISKDKDQFYYSCVEQICPTKSLLK